MSLHRFLTVLASFTFVVATASSARGVELLSIDEAQLIADGEAPDGDLFKVELYTDTSPGYEFRYLRRTAEVVRRVEIDAVNGDVRDTVDQSPGSTELARLIEVLDAVPNPAISFQEAADAALNEVGRGVVFEIVYDLRREVSVMKVEVEDGMDKWDVVVRSSDGAVLEVDGPPVDPEGFGFVDAVLAAEDAVRGGVAFDGELSFVSDLDIRVYTIRVLDPAQMLARVLRYAAADGALIFDRTDPAPIENFMRLYDFYNNASFDLADSAVVAEAACPVGVTVNGAFQIRDGRLLGDFELADGFDRPIVVVDTEDGAVLRNDCDDSGSMMIGFVDAVELGEEEVRDGIAYEGELEFDERLDERVYTVYVLDPEQSLTRVLRYAVSDAMLLSDRTDPDPIENFDRIYNFIESADFGLAETAAISEDTCEGNEIIFGELDIRNGGLFGVFEFLRNDEDDDDDDDDDEDDEDRDFYRDDDDGEYDDDDELFVVVNAFTGEVLRSDCEEEDECDDPGLNPGLVRAINAAERECPDGDVLSAEFVTGDGRARYDVDVLALEPARIKSFQIKPGARGTVLDQSERRVTDEEAPLLRQVFNLLPDAELTWEEALVRARETYCEGQPRSIALDVARERLVYRVGIRQGQRITYVLVDAITGRAGLADEVLDERVRVSAGAAGTEDLDLDARGGAQGVVASYRTDRGVLVYLEYDPAEDRWYATVLNDRGEMITEEAESDAFEDAKNGRRFITVATNAGTMLIDPVQSAARDRNLTEELPGATPIVEKQTTLITVDGLAVVAGLDDAGDLVAYFQTRESRTDGEEVWAYVNLSRDHLAAQGLETPAFADDLVGYVTPWNGLNIAGLDDDGRIMSVWWAPGMSLWSVADLSALTGAEPMVGGLTVYVTEWGGINLAGLDDDGQVVVAWWVPSFGGDWAKNNLSREFGHRGFGGGEMVSYVTPWGGTNIAGLDDDGQLVVYWWAPGMEQWIVSPLSSLVQGAILPVGELTASTTDDGLINLLGFSEDGDLIRYHWRPGAEWDVENTSDMIEPMR